MNSIKFKSLTNSKKLLELYNILNTLNTRTVLLEQLLIYHIYDEGNQDDLFNQWKKLNKRV